VRNVDRNIRDFEVPVDLQIGEEIEPFQTVPTNVDEVAFFDKYVSVDTVHDGWFIPERFVEGFTKDEREALTDTFADERDWGAHLVADYLSRQLNLSSCSRVTLARALLDFNRFPGESRSSHNHLGRLAINPPFTDKLSYDQKHALMSEYYDTISHRMDDAVSNRLVKIAVHTYDQHNESGTERPAVSVINRPESYQLSASLPWGTFDPMYPAILGEFMASRVLTYRIALSLEKRQVPVALNFPYLLPDGSVELRSQVWYFFRHLRDHYEERCGYADTNIESAFELVWSMLMDTNARSSASLAFREYVHAFRRAPRGLEPYFDRGRESYDVLRSYIREHQKDLVDDYRYSKWRPSSLAVEIRKDYLWEFDGLNPQNLHVDRARRAVEGIAEGIREYLVTDLGIDANTDAEKLIERN
jgi:hypothetical protein